MRGKVARQIRGEVYGEFAPQSDARKYGRHKVTGAIHAHVIRQKYQEAKRYHVEGTELPEPVRQRDARLKQQERTAKRKKARKNLRKKGNA